MLNLSIMKFIWFKFVKLYLFFITLMLGFFILPAQASDVIGQITKSVGKVQIKTIKAKRINGVEGTQINLGDFFKVKKKSMAILAMKDTSKFQVSEKTTLIFDNFLYDSSNQKMRVRIIDGALAYDGKKLISNSDRKVISKGFTLTIRGTKFAAKFGPTSQIVLLKGAVELAGKGQKQLLSGPSMQSVTFDSSGIGLPFKMSLIEVKAFFAKHDLDFDLLMGPEYKPNKLSGGKNCFGSNC